MNRDLLNTVLSELRTGQCMRDVARYWGFRSTVPGPGLHAASNYLCQRYHESGLDAQGIAYPADDETPNIDGRTNPLAWTPRSVSLRIVAPGERTRLVCRYADEPLCLISNSTSTPANGTETEVVVVDHADQDGSYEGLDVSGKIILVDLPSFTVEAQACKTVPPTDRANGACPRSCRACCAR
jgi:hypothetical protein